MLLEGDRMIRRMVLTFGEPLAVFAHKGRDGLAVSRDFQMDCAGAELNTAIALARLKVEVAYAAALGADPFGDFILRELRAEQVDVSRVEQVESISTGVLFKMTSGLREDPSVMYYRKNTPMALGRWTGGGCAHELHLGHFSWVHATGIVWMVSEETRAHAQQIVQTAFENGTPVSFDINLRLKMAELSAWQQVLIEVLPYLRWLMIGDTEARQLFGTDQASDVDAAIKQWGFRGEGLVLKAGAKGATVYRDGGTHHVKAWPVERVVDTVGAGDGFNAGFIAGLLKEWGMEETLTLASLIGAHAVTSKGDSSGYPMWSSVESMLKGDGEVTR